MNPSKPFLSDEELENARHNGEQLGTAQDIFYSIIRLAALVPKALNDSNDRLFMGFFGMFLKTILADLRSVQVLTSIGYPFSAATVASSLWEKSVMGRFILKAPKDRIPVYLKHPTKKSLPWNMKTMLGELVSANSVSERRKAVDMYYVQYTFLCSLKHPQAATISKASEFHFDQSRPMELKPASCGALKDFNFLILTQSIYSTLEFMKFTFPVFCSSELVNGCLHLCGKLGNHCFVENPSLDIPEELGLPPQDLTPEAISHLRRFWETDSPDATR